MNSSSKEGGAATAAEPLIELADALRQSGYRSWTEVADEIRITKQGVSEIVNGRTRSATARYALAKALGYEVDQIRWPEPAEA